MKFGAVSSADDIPATEWSVFIAPQTRIDTTITYVALTTVTLPAGSNWAVFGAAYAACYLDATPVAYVGLRGTPAGTAGNWPPLRLEATADGTLASTSQWSSLPGGSTLTLYCWAQAESGTFFLRSIYAFVRAHRIS